MDLDKTERIMAQIKDRQEKEKIIRLEEEKVKLVIFTLCDNFYAFYGHDIKEILRYEEIAYVPGCPDYIMGIINVRGDIESVLNLHRLLSLSDPQISKETRIAIADNSNIRSGILLDSVADVLDVPVNAIKEPVSTIDSFVKEFAIGGETLYKNKYVTILDIKKIFEILMAKK